jgi:hypothetical protein
LISPAPNIFALPDTAAPMPMRPEAARAAFMAPGSGIVR